MLNRLKSLQAQGKLETAEANFVRVLKEAPRHLHAWLGLGYCASLKGDLEEALRSIETAVAIGSADEDGIIDCSTALSHLGKLEAARGLFTTRPESLRLQVAVGELEERQGRYDAAMVCYEAAHEIDPAADLPLRKLISLNRRCGALATAHAMADRLARIDKQQEAAAWYFRGQIHSAAGDRDAAIAALRMGLEGSPHPYSEACTIDLARELRQLRKLDEACAALSDHAPTYSLLLALSDLELSRRDHTTALRHAAAARALEPRKPDALVRIGRIEADRCDYAAAHAAADQLDACGPEHRIAALRCRLDAFRAAGEEQEAVRILQEMAALQPADAGILAELARQYRATGDGVAAQRTLQTALAREPDNVVALTEAGEQANGHEDRPTALGYFRRIQALAPDHAGHHLRVARLLDTLGETEEAHQIYQAAEARFGLVADIWGERIRVLRETGELHRALDEARQAHAAYPAHFGRWSDHFDLELKLSPIETAAQCLEQAPVQSRGEEVHYLTARARLASRTHDREQAITLLETALRLQPNNRGVLGELFRQHVRAFNIDQAATYHARMAALDAPGRRIRGTTPNASQSHEGQVLNDLFIDRRAVTELMAIKAIDPVHRVSLLLPLVRKRPDHIPTAAMLLVTLQEGDLLNRPTDAASAAGQSDAVPKRIGQFWDSPNPPQDLLDLGKTWRDRNPDHHYVLFSDQTAQSYLASHFPAAVVIAYRRCMDATTKADLFRLAFLTHEGGTWADMDDRCIVPLAEVIPNGVEALFWQESTGHLCNNFMAAKPGHPVLRRALVTAVSAINRGDRDKVWMLTGPGLLSRAFAAEMAEAGDQWPAWLGRIAVLDEFEIWSRVAIHCQTSYKRLGKHWLKTAFERPRSRQKILQ